MEADETICPDCAETIKRAASVCKHCGCRQLTRRDGATQSPQNSKGILIFIGICMAAFGAFSASQHFNILNGQDVNAAIIDKAKAAISEELIDPSSAQFKDIKFNHTCVEGEVNSKNRLGGYVGFKRFFYDGKIAKAAILDDAPDAYASDLESILPYARWSGDKAQCTINALGG